MKTSLFDYHLPENLIASHPPKERDGGKLLVINPVSKTIVHEQVHNLHNLLPPNSLIIANNSKVIPARLNGKKTTGGAVEVLLVRQESAQEDFNKCRWRALCKANKSIKTGDKILLDSVEATVISSGERGEKLLEINVSADEFRTVFTSFGNVPLPPYIKRKATTEDIERYQTVYASPEGSVAAPTAGLHITNEMLKNIKEAGHETAFVTLHVGPGTFRPITADNLDEHLMDKEYFEISQQTVTAVEQAKQDKRPIVAIGTTAVRALEGCAGQNDGKLKAGTGSTRIFISPPYDFKIVDALLTNFHLPKSTLLCLVSALGGREFVLDSYKHAVKEQYRFYSYGDAMLVLPNTP